MLQTLAKSISFPLAGIEVMPVDRKCMHHRRPESELATQAD